MVNSYLTVIEEAEPSKEWRIVTSGKHSAVWDGENTIFDPQFLALGVTIDEAWTLLTRQHDTRVLDVGERLVVHLAERVY
jgi:hypothetical protein